MIVLVMGVSGCGKSTLGAAIADRLDCRFLEGDEFHPPANVEKMRRGDALTDGDRQPWLQALHDSMFADERAQKHVVVACSALKRTYRSILFDGIRAPRLIHLVGEIDTIAGRMERPGHFMPPSLLASQIATLEVPGHDEPHLQIDITRPAAACVTDALDYLFLVQKSSS